MDQVQKYTPTCVCVYMYSRQSRPYVLPVAVLYVHVLFLTSSLPFLTFSNFNSFISFPPPSHFVHLASLAHRGKPVVFKSARGARPRRGAGRVQFRHVREFLLFKTLNFVSNGAFGLFKIRTFRCVLRFQLGRLDDHQPVVKQFHLLVRRRDQRRQPRQI